MPSYTAPVKDMMFLYEKLRDNKNYNELEKYNEVNSDLVKDILEEAAKINQNLILPLAKVGDENPAVLENGVVRTPPGYKEAYQKYIEDGWTSLSCDPKYGGQGMPKTVSAFFDEMLSSASLSFKLYSELSIGAYNCINRHASDEIKNTGQLDLLLVLKDLLQGVGVYFEFFEFLVQLLLDVFTDLHGALAHDGQSLIDIARGIRDLMHIARFRVL